MAQPPNANRVEPSPRAGFVRVEGRFFRAVDAQFRDAVLAGSNRPGRYSAADQPTLYLSASPEGVDAALLAHQRAGQPARITIPLEVEADCIFDLRNAGQCAEAGINLADATAPWQQIVAAGGEPSSWKVAARLRSLGANGLIDPSRKAPGLWHLVLFQWNQADGPSVRLA